MSNRYEILPFGSPDAELEGVDRPLTVTVTCSPRHGLDHTVDWAVRIAALGHRPVVHLAARAVRDAWHLDAVLERLADHGVDDVFLIAGDGGEPAGPFASAVELLPVVTAHPRRPGRIGVGAYPEGHPLIDRAALVESLRRKSEHADYMVTQLCFEPGTLLSWLEGTREAGVDLPLYAGLPGSVDRRRLLEVSMRIGVGTSIAFLRKQRGIRNLLARREDATDRLHGALAPLVGDPRLGIAGLHFFTFNRLQATLAWEDNRAPGHVSHPMTTTGAATS
jgi:methylenetetrahydrofolate reductase (NADPH)